MKNTLPRSGSIPLALLCAVLFGPAVVPLAAQAGTGVAVTGGELANVAVVLVPADEAPARDGEVEGDTEAATFAEGITVESTAAESGEAALLVERKQAAQISDAIGREEIGRTTGSDAAGVLKRVTGISIQEDKFVYVRGLGDRYSNTTVNGSKIPSTEFEKRVVPLNLFPTSLLEKISVSKSYTVDKPGDFAAGFVDLRTLDDAQYPDFCFDVQITPQGGPPIDGTREPACIEDTVCLSGALPGRSEVYVRILGPRPNGFLWPTLVRFTPSQVNVSIFQISTQQTQDYQLDPVGPNEDDLSGLQDRTGFQP